MQLSKTDLSKLSQAQKLILGRVAQQALDVQNACNASGIINSLSENTRKLWDIAHELGQGTDYVNHHPVVIAFLFKLGDLCAHSGLDGYARNDEGKRVANIGMAALDQCAELVKSCAA